MQQWYGVKTFPGYEYKVQERLNKLREKDGLDKQITEIFIPTNKTFTFVRRDLKLKEELIFPGYVFIKMNLTNELMYTVRGVQYILGYAGINESKKKPDIVTEEEIQKMIENSKHVYTTLNPGNNVLYSDGFIEEEITIKTIDPYNQTLTSTDNRAISFNKIKKIK